MRLPELTARERGMARALEIQMREEPKRWRQLVDAIENLEERAAADNYLRGIVERMKVVASLRRGDNRHR